LGLLLILELLRQFSQLQLKWQSKVWSWPCTSAL